VGKTGENEHVESANDQIVYFCNQHILSTYFTAMSNDFVKVKLSFHSSFFYHMFSIGARKLSLFLDPVLSIRMALLRLQL